MAVQISELISHFAEMRSELMSMTQTAPITTPDPIEINTLENHIMIDKTHYLAGETVHVSGWMDLNEPRHHQLVDGTHVYRNLETRFTLSVDGTDPTTQRLGPYGQTWINHVNHIVGHPHGNDDDCTMTLSKDLTVHDEFCTLGNLTVFSNGTFTSNFNVDILQLAGMYELKFGAHHGTYEKLLSNEFRVGP